jgi:NAD(P)-dependent dehydrogenase (short-subunit alcohol dehydrogenase family)
MKVAGRSVLVTGGSRGLGRALGASLARRGARVVLTATGGEALDEAVAGIRREGGDAHGLVSDQGAKEDVHPLAGAASALVGPIDVLVLNASTLGPVPLRELSETECEDFARVLEVNLLGPFRLAKAVVGSMMLRGGGLIVGISSDAAVNGYAGWGAYGVSKAGLDQMLRTWAAELEGTGVVFLGIDPGEMDTEMHAQAVPEADRAALARPDEVAEKVADVMESDAVRSGTRIEVATLARVA